MVAGHSYVLISRSIAYKNKRISGESIAEKLKHINFRLMRQPNFHVHFFWLQCLEVLNYGCVHKSKIEKKHKQLPVNFL